MARKEDSALEELESLASEVQQQMSKKVIAQKPVAYEEAAFPGYEESFPGIENLGQNEEEEDEDEDDEDREAAEAYRRLYEQKQMPELDDDDLQPLQSVTEEKKQGDAQSKTKKRKKKQKTSETTTDNGAPQVNENPSDLYVEGLPLDITLPEFVEYFSKVGIIRKDLETGTLKVKLYKTPDGLLKGDGLVCYFKKESVDLAISILDGAEIRPGHPIKVSKAKFVLKPNAQRKRKRSKKAKTIDQSKELGWEEDGQVHVIIKNMFSPLEATGDPNFFQELREDISAEASKMGLVDKVSVFEHNPEGVVAIKFKSGEGAHKCIEVMNGRFFAGRQLEAFFYDGLTDYNVAEDEETKAERVAQWEKWLEEGGDEDEDEDGEDLHENK